MARQNTKLEAEAAEFLVLGHLLLHRIPTYKTYTNMPGYDLVATNPERNTSAKIQVKSRWATGAAGFPIKNFGCDFVVVALLNRGHNKRSSPVKAPDYYVLPVEIVKKVHKDGVWPKVSLRDIGNLESYREKWESIENFLDP